MTHKPIPIAIPDVPFAQFSDRFNAFTLPTTRAEQLRFAAWAGS